jgi:hypothetical protein
MKLSKEQLISVIANMDIAELSKILGDDSNLMGVNKTNFIEILSDLFHQLRVKYKETKLLPSNGICCEKECDNFGCFGVCFRGTKSDTYLSLVIETNAEDQVTDLSVCQFFQLTTGEILKESLEIDIKDEQLLSFIPDPKYYILLQQANKAYDELCQADINFYFVEDLQVWNEKYYHLYLEIADGFTDFTAFYPFLLLFMEVSKTIRVLTTEADFPGIKREFNTCVYGNRDKLEKWYKKHESLYLLISELEKHYNYAHTSKGYLQISDDPLVRVSFVGMQDRVEFLQIFRKAEKLLEQ